MSEYISRDAIHAKIEKEVERYFDDPAPTDGYYLVEDVLSEIENFAAADVAPVRHGRWALRPGMAYRYEGSCCHCDGAIHFKFCSYCPECGAQMDLETP